MIYRIFYFAYTLLYPIFLLVSLPGFLIKMRRRGGRMADIWERLSLFRVPAEQEPSDVIYVHAVSVGEVFIALKWIRTLRTECDLPIVLATSTATGLQVARDAGIPNLRVLYSPVDIGWVVRRCMRRFSPRVVALIEAELWPTQARVCRRAGIPMVMLNARLSERSERRYAAVRRITAPLFSHLSALAAQNDQDAARFARIGVPPSIIRTIGSIKFDVQGEGSCQPRQEFCDILHHLAGNRPIVLAASTHPGEELLIASAARKNNAFTLIVPRHMERRAEVMRDLSAAGFSPILRSEALPLPENPDEKTCYIADTTGELREWTALADIVVIGKSFLQTEGGQNPVEAISSRRPVIVGPHMENFSDLVAQLRAVDGIVICTADELQQKIADILANPGQSVERSERAFLATELHNGATLRSLRLVQEFLHTPSAR